MGPHKNGDKGFDYQVSVFICAYCALSSTIYSSKICTAHYTRNLFLLIVYTAALICMHTRKNNKFGNEKNRVTVVLACAGDGSKLKPLIIFKCKTMPKIQNKHGVVVAVQKKDWMDIEIMKIWIEKV